MSDKAARDTKEASPLDGRTVDPASIKPSEPELSSKQIAKMLLEVGPLGVFLAVNSQAGKFLANPDHAIFWGTGAFMVATAIALVVSRAMLGKVPLMPLVSGVFVLFFGGLTLILQDQLFIKMKPTFVNVAFAGILLGGLAFGQAFTKILFGEVFRLNEEGWRVLTIRWAVFFLFLAVLNEVVWRTQSTEFWISFKVWGMMPLTMLFAVAQIGLVKRYEA